MKDKVVVSWSGGKDSSLALHEILNSASYLITGLLTTINSDFDRISMHGIRRSLLHQQAVSLGFPIHEVYISKDATDEEYETQMKTTLMDISSSGVHTIVSGDIFLEDVRRYREEKLSILSMRCLFPLWLRDTNNLAKEFILEGFKATIACVDTKVLDQSFAGREYNQAFLEDLPERIDPCGENGEFHTFVHDGPIFKHPIKHEKGEVVLRDNRFAFCDFIG